MMDFDELLNARRARPLAMPAPGAFAQDVLRQIRMRKAARLRGTQGWMAWWEGVWKPSVLAACLVTALTIGALTPVVVRRAPSKAPTVLDLEIFRGNSHNVPSGLLGSIS